MGRDGGLHAWPMVVDLAARSCLRSHCASALAACKALSPRMAWETASDPSAPRLIARMQAASACSVASTSSRRSLSTWCVPEAMEGLLKKVATEDTGCIQGGVWGLELRGGRGNG